MAVEAFIKEFKKDIKSVTDLKINLKEGGYIKREAVALGDWAVINRRSMLKDTGNQHILLADEQADVVIFFKEVIIKVSEKEETEVSEQARRLLDNLDRDEYPQCDMTDFIPVIDTKEKNLKDLYFMVHADTDRVVDISHLAWKETLDQDTVSMIASNKLYGVKLYNPRLLDASYEGRIAYIPSKSDEEQPQGTVYNTYMPPEWRFNKIKDAKIPTEFTAFFEHLFENKDCREFMFRTLYTILTSRSEVFTVLNGQTGIGKGILTDEIMMNAVGVQNHIIAPVSWDRSLFNAWMKDRQVIVLDEAKVTVEGQQANVNLLKRLINERQNIEEKGKDPKQTAESFASFFINQNNGTKNFKLELDNRRFSIPDVTKNKFADVFGSETKYMYQTLTKDIEKQRQFFWWLLQRYDGEYIDQFTLWKGDTYWKFRLESLSRWQRFLVHLAVDLHTVSISLSQLSDDYEIYCENQGWANGKLAIKPETIERFLLDYHHGREQKKIGKLVRKGGDTTFIVSDYYVTTEEDV